MSEVKVLWIACMNNNTKLKIYAIDKKIEFFYVIVFVI
jgi:hypothetical protein